MKKLLFIAVLLGAVSGLLAQDENDALLFSQTNWSGTARFMGAGGALGAIGGDFSAVSTNPASLGLYKKMEFTFTPMVVNVLQTTNEYNNQDVKTNRVRFSLAGTSAVIPLSIGGENSKWQKIQLAFGYNRIQDYNKFYNAVGMSNGSSITDYFANLANGIDYTKIGDYGTSMNPDATAAWQCYLIDPITENLYYGRAGNANLRQEHFYKSWGGNEEMSLSVGSNYDDQLYLGFSLGIPFINYHMTSEYTEEDVNDEVPDFEKAVVTDNLSVSAVGINGKLGVIYQPAQFVRLGVAVHTPTYYGNVRETLTRDFESIALNQDTTWVQCNESYENRMRYKLTTPLRVVGSVGFIIAKRAFVSAEYEFADYGMSNLTSSDSRDYRYDFKKENDNIAKKFKACHSVRLGCEFMVNDIFSLRAGYGYTSSPYKEDAKQGTRHTASCGLGIHGRLFFFDLAYVYSHTTNQYWFYTMDNLNPVSVKNNSHRIIATLGLKLR